MMGAVFFCSPKGGDEMKRLKINRDKGKTFKEGFVSVKVLASFIDSKIVIKYPYKDSGVGTVPQNSL